MHFLRAWLKICDFEYGNHHYRLPSINIHPSFHPFCNLFYSGVAVCVQSVQSACPSWIPPKAEYKDKNYYRNCQGLSTIPDNIPAEALEVRIRGNPIRRVPADAFSQLSHCTILNLGWNEIEQIEPGAFNGLISLEQLYLYYNKLSEIEPGTFSHLPALDTLSLRENKLTTLPWTVFTDGTGNITRPARLSLALRQNPFQCDTTLCWVKQGQQDGWFTWWLGYDPDCANYPDTNWSDVNLQCDSIGKPL